MAVNHKPFDIAAPDLAALYPDPVYLHVPDAPTRDADSLCRHAEQVLDLLNHSYQERLASHAVTPRCARNLTYARYAVGSARSTLTAGDRISAVAQLADSVSHLREAWGELVDEEK